MDKKHLWIIVGVIAVLIPVILVLCLNIFVWDKNANEVIPQKVDNGGTIAPTGNQGLYEFKSKYGYKLNYNPKYNVDLSSNQYDFYIYNDDKSVNVQVTPIPRDENIISIDTKEEWDTQMSQLGPCIEFNKTSFNGMDVLIAHYNVSDKNGDNKLDMIVANLIGKEYIYTYCYAATNNATETEAQQIGAILYTITE